MDLIIKESGKEILYMKTFLRRHPDILMKSFASLEAKINFIQRDLNRQIKKEKSFPILLMHSYNKVIYPRGTLLKEKLNYFDLEKAFFTTD